MLTLKAFERGSRSIKATIVYQLLLTICSVATMSIFEKQLIELPAREKSIRKPTSLFAMGRAIWPLRRASYPQVCGEAAQASGPKVLWLDVGAILALLR